MAPPTPAMQPGRRQQWHINRRALAALVSGRPRYFRALTTTAQVVALYSRAWPLGADARERAHAVAAQRVAELCRRNGGLWTKAAQFFSSRSDLLPPVYIEALQTLQNDAAPVAFAQLKPVLRSAYGPGWQQLFSFIDEAPVATASIAQVHRAVLASGEAVALKVRLPAVEKVFEQDARVFRLLARWLSPLVRVLDVVQVTEHLLAMTEEELDLRHEAHNLQRFARLEQVEGICVPTLVPELSKAQVMVTHWLAGQRLREFLDAHPAHAPLLLGRLLDSYVQQVTRYGLYHADPHPGNFIVTPDGTLAILDFGAVGRLTAPEVQRYSRLLFGLLALGLEQDQPSDEEVDALGQLFVDAGFEGGDPATLRELSRYVLTDRMQRQAPLASMGDLMERFREARIRIPDSYIGISRVLITLGGFLMQYQVPLTWQASVAPGAGSKRPLQ